MGTLNSMYQKSFRKRVYPFTRTYPYIRDAANVIGGAYRNYRQRQINRRRRFRSRNMLPHNPVAMIIRNAFRVGRPVLRNAAKRVNFSEFNRYLKKRKY